MKKLIISILVFTSGLNLFSQDNIENQIFDIGIESIESFREFLSIKNDANYKNEMKPLIEWGINNFKKYKDSDSLLMLESLPASETRNYIKLVLTNLWIYKVRFKVKNSILSVLASGKPINSKIFFNSETGS